MHCFHNTIEVKTLGVSNFNIQNSRYNITLNILQVLDYVMTRAEKRRNKKINSKGYKNTKPI
jgi:hypothetical protein